jgi:peptide alpha-N-acetyltransferase
MLRPLIQAKRSRKLLFLYLLRSSSALATSEPHHGTSVTYNTNSQVYNPDVGHIQLRVATRSDVSAIQRCNLATLPENYSSNFYINHLRQWPDLALVAEHVKPSSSSSSSSTVGKTNRNPFDLYDPSQTQNENVGYVLGKVEETALSLPPSRVEEESEQTHSDPTLGQGFFSYHRKNHFLPSTEKKTEMMGHVTSLAVLSNYRRRGLAAMLMKQLHFHMEEGYNADGVGLHVRVSNAAARRLYCEGMGYGVVDVIRGYYQDGEDAFFMRKTFKKGGNHQNNRIRRRFGSNAGQGMHPSVFDNCPEEYRLPIIIPLTNDVSPPITTRSYGLNDSEQEFRVISGGF